MKSLDLVRLSQLMERTSGSPAITIGLIDGPVATSHPDLVSENIREVPGALNTTCAQASSLACIHGTLVAGILCAKRTSLAPAICPRCTLIVRPIFAESTAPNSQLPSTTPGELAVAIIESVDAGARVLNMSVGLSQLSSKGERQLEEALSYAARRQVICVVAAGNQGIVGSSAVTRHPWVIPVVACNEGGQPIGQSNIGRSIGTRGLLAPGNNVTSLGSSGETLTFGGTSAATPFVTGAIALLLSEFPSTNATELKLVITQAHARHRKTVVPPLLDAWGTYQAMAAGTEGAVM
jgi:subtilisin family serine protease